jgi:multiple sugar transport system permease protein
MGGWRAAVSDVPLAQERWRLKTDRDKGIISRWLGKNPHIPYMFPTMLAMALVSIVPLIFVIGISFTNYELGILPERIRLVGMRNYLRLFNGQDDVFFYSLFITLSITVIATTIQMVLGFFSALLLNEDFKLKGLAIACFIVPIAMTPSIASQVWKLMYNSESGVINYFLDLLFGAKIVWLGPKYAFLSVLITNIWMSTPFVTLVIYAGLRSLPLEPYESAVIDGASSFQLFKWITLPLLKPLTLLTMLFRVIDMFKMFDIPYVLTQGGPGDATEFLGLRIYRIGFGVTGLVGRASAISVILILIVAVLSLILITALRKNSMEGTR